MKYKAYNVTWKCRGYGVDPHRLEKYMVGLEDYRYCKGVRRLGKSLEWRPDPWQDINEKPRKYRSWKAHSKCRHQWERHEPPAIEGGWSWDEDGSKGDHRRKWVMDCLKKKGVCIFNVHHDKGLENFLENCENWEIRRLGHGLIEATLLVQEAGEPKTKKSPGEKRQSGKSRRRAKHRERIKRRKAAILAVKERIRLASRKGGRGVSRPRQEYKRKHVAKKMSPAYLALYDAAKEDHVRGVTRRNVPSLNLLRNYSHYSSVAKYRSGLNAFDHDYQQFPSSLEQTCVWLTGRRPCEFPPWAITMLANGLLPEKQARRILRWTVGAASVRDVYGLSKNEAHEIMSLPPGFRSEQSAIVAAIAFARHCNAHLTVSLAFQVPTFGELLNSPERCDFVRRFVDWLVAVDADLMGDKLHDLLDFFFRSGIWRNPNFSFKGRTLQRVERLMRDWHRENMLRRGLTKEEFVQKWDKHDFDCEVNPYRFKELLSPKELMEEGNRQHNCVFSYHGLCKNGTSAIVSMISKGECSDGNLTLEIRGRRIVQIRGVCNRLPYKEEMRIVRTFASLKNLTIA